MVKQMMLLTALCVSCVCQAQEQPMSAEELREYFSLQSQKSRSAAERMKAAEFDRNSLRMLSDEPITYQFRNGKTVLGMILDNGKLSPAIKTETGMVPACVTRSYQLIEGRWNSQTEQIECTLESSKLAFIDNQVGSDGKAPVIASTRYGDKGGGQGGEGEGKACEEGQNCEASLSFSEGGKAVDRVIKTVVDAVSTPSPDKAAKTPSADPNIYTPPPRNGVQGNSVAGVLNLNRGFGILKGTWIKAKIDRPVTNTESGQMEIVLTEGVQGRYKYLPKGTILFANKIFNASNRRLEAMTTMAVTPGGDEIDGINAYVFSLNKTAGLIGIIERNLEGELKASGSNVAIDVVKRLLPGGNIATDAVSELSSDMLDNQRDAGPIKPEVIIRVAPQVILVKVASSF